MKRADRVEAVGPWLIRLQQINGVLTMRMPREGRSECSASGDECKQSSFVNDCANLQMQHEVNQRSKRVRPSRRHAPPEEIKEAIMEDYNLGAVRGIVFAMIISLPIWAVILVAIHEMVKWTH